ncbi:MAG: DUF4330 domain-containing protein [Acetivibrionales bacterium]|jgi:hypothetical protein
MIVNKKGRLFGKVNVIDLFVMLVIIAVIAGVGYTYINRNKEASFSRNLEDIQVEFYQEEVNDFTAKSIKIGDPVRESVQNASFGRVTDIKIEEAVSWIKTGDGKNISAPKPGYSSVYITMEAKGIIGSNGVTIDNSVYRIGQTMVLYVGNSAFWGRISDITKKGD